MSPQEFLLNSRSKIVELETLLTSIPAIAPEGGGDGETKKCDALEAWLKQNGFSDAGCTIERYEAPDSRVSSRVRPSLVVTIPGKDDSQRVWVMAHIDVVPVGDLSLWNTDPWKVVEKDGKLYGRGVEDNQQGLCSAVFAGLYFIKNGIVPAHTVKLLFVADEENGSEYGAIWLIRNTDLFQKNDRDDVLRQTASVTVGTPAKDGASLHELAFLPEKIPGTGYYSRGYQNIRRCTETSLHL